MNLNDILKYNSESSNIDFKQIEYPLGQDCKKTEFLKDISAMANHPSNEAKFIFVGVVEKNGVAESFIDIPKLTDQAKYQQYLDQNIEPSINFEYKCLEHEGYRLGCFVIKDNNVRPYLFKKEIKGSKNNEIIYKPGDGFIRVGTSTRKMVRSDFENIYKSRQELIDRKSDIIITPCLKKTTNTIMQDLGYQCIDFNIENVSNKSICFDIEARFKNTKDYIFIKKFDLDQQILRESQSKFTSSFSIQFKPIVDYSIFDLSIKREKSTLIVSRKKRINQTATVEIPQNDLLEDIFVNEILVLKYRDAPIHIDLFLRSDDFVEGALKQKFSI